MQEYRSITRHPVIIKIIAALLTAVCLPVVLKVYLQADVSPLLFLLPVFVTSGVGILLRVIKERRKWLGALSSVVILLFAFIVLMGILITPYSSYSIWFESVKTGSLKGSVSNLFVLVLAFFSSLIGPMILTADFLWPFLMLALVIIFLFSVIYQTALLFIIALICTGLCLVFLSIRWGEKKHKTVTAVFTLAVFAFTFSIAQIISANVDLYGSAVVDRTLHPRLRDTLISLFPGFPLLYAIPGYGYSFDEAKLGGTPNLSSLPIFEVEGKPGETLYLRETVYDFYDGKSWKLSVSSKKAKEGLLSKGSEEMLSADKYEGDILLTLSIEYYNRLPYTIDTSQIITGEQKPEMKSGNFETGFVLKKPLGFGDTILVKRRPGRAEADAPRLNPELERPYLQIHADISEELKTVAARLGENGNDPRQILTGIENYLSYNASYNLRPEQVGGNLDFVESFLFYSRTGYCVHFASSFIILARLNGIPARYATGFLVYLPADTGKTEITGFSSHAWPEVWLEGTGWVTWEATSAVNPLYYGESGEDWIYDFDIDLNRRTTRQIEMMLGKKVLPKPSAGVPLSGYLLIPVLVIPACIFLFLVIRFFGSSLIYPFKNAEKRFYHKLKRLVKITVKCGVPEPGNVGWLEWAWDILKRVPEEAERIEKLSDRIIRTFYGDGLFEKGYLDSVRHFSRYVVKKIPHDIPAAG